MKCILSPILLFLIGLITSEIGHAGSPPSQVWMRSLVQTGRSPVAVGLDGTIYSSSSDGTNGVLAIDGTGRVLWGYPDRTAQYSAPVIGNQGELYSITSDRRLVCLEPQGTLRWEIKLTQDVLHIPAVGPEGTVYFGDRGGALHAIRPDGTRVWSVQQASQFSSSAPVVRSDGSILIADFEGGLRCFAPDGTRRWWVSYPGSVIGTPALGDEGRIRVLYYPGLLRCFNEDGSLAWQYQLQAQVEGVSPVVDSSGTTYVGTVDAGLFAVGANGQKLWNRPVSAGIASTPVLTASGSLVVPGYERQVLFYGTNGLLSGRVSVELRLSGGLTITPSGLVLALSGSGELYAIQTDLRIQGGAWPMVNGNTRLNGRGRSRPTVTLVDPDPTKVHRTDEGVPLSVKIGTEGNTIARVEYRTGTNLVAVSTNSPFASRWASPPPGVSPLTARVIDESGGSAESATVLVKAASPGAAPLWISHPTSISTNAGTAFSSVVESLSTTPTTYTWFLDGRPVSGADGPVLTLAATTPNFSGRYTVVASNAFGATTSAPAAMTFLLEPEVFWSREMATRSARPSIGADGLLYVQSANGLLALDRAGTVQWVFPGWMNDGIPIADDGSMIVNQENRFLTSLDATGRVLWSIGTAQGATGLARDRRGEVFLATTDGFLERRGPDGTLRWRSAIGAQDPTTPMISTLSQVILGAVDGRVRAFSSSGEKLWESDSLGAPIRGGAIAPSGTLVFSGNNRLIALGPDGTLQWQITLPGTAGIPVIAPDGAIHIGMSDQPDPNLPVAGRVSVYEADGRLRWSQPVEYPALQAGAIASDGTLFIPVGHRLVAWNRNGTLRFRLSTEGDNLGAPLIGFDGTVYMADGRSRFFALRGTQPMPSNGWPCTGRDVRGRSDASSNADPDSFFFPTASNGFDDEVSTILAPGDGSLVVGGQFQIAGGRPAARIAGWNGTNWFPIGNGFTGKVVHVVRWGTNLVALASSDRRGGVVPFPFLWDGTTWKAIHQGLADGMAASLVVHEGQLLGSAIFAGQDGIRRPYLARWNGTEWGPVGEPMEGQGLTRFASGPNGLHAFMDQIVLRFDGTRWEQLGGIFNEPIASLLDSPSGLLVSGAFTFGGTDRGRVARWDGTSWVPVGGGLGGIPPYVSYAQTLASDGQNLYVGGFFTLPGSTNAVGIARWDGTRWTALRNQDAYLGLEDNHVRTLAWADGRLYAGGYFLRTGDRRDLRHFAVFDGAWKSLGNPVLTVDPQLGVYLFNVLGRPYVVESSDDLVVWRERFRYQQTDEPLLVPKPPGDTSDRRFYRIVVP